MEGSSISLKKLNKVNLAKKGGGILEKQKNCIPTLLVKFDPEINHFP